MSPTAATPTDRDTDAPGGGLPPDGPDVPEVALDDDDPAPGIVWSTPRVLVVAVLVAVVAGVGAVLLQQRVSTPSADSVDVGFLRDMTDHHSQAVEIATLAADRATDPVVRSFAREVLIFQQREVGYMEALQEEWGLWPAPADRLAMEWMDMAPTPVAQMPGMQPEARVKALSRMTGPQVDAEFLQMMTDHHRGGIHMAEDAAERAGDPRVRDLAARMASQQASEIREYQAVAQRLGVPLP